MRLYVHDLHQEEADELYWMGSRNQKLIDDNELQRLEAENAKHKRQATTAKKKLQVLEQRYKVAMSHNLLTGIVLGQVLVIAAYFVGKWL